MAHLSVSWVTSLCHESLLVLLITDLYHYQDSPACTTCHLPVLWVTILYYESPACIIKHLPVSHESAAYLSIIWLTYMRHIPRESWLTYPNYDSHPLCTSILWITSSACLMTHLSVLWVMSCVYYVSPTCIMSHFLPVSWLTFLYYDLRPACIMTHLFLTWIIYLYHDSPASTKNFMLLPWITWLYYEHGR